MAHRTKRKTNEEFIKESRLIHGNRYDYSKVEYINQLTRVCIICPEHGEFWQTPKQHLRGRGCYACYKERDKINGRKSHKHNHKSWKFIRGEDCANPNAKFSKNDFIRYATEKWGGKYDYSLVEYTGYKEKVDIICPKHGIFRQTPHNHLRACGCTGCNSEKKRIAFSQTREQFIEKAKKVFNNRYTYDNVDYINNKTHVLITCRKHGDFPCTPANHLKGRGCPICKSENYVYEERLYDLLRTVFKTEQIIRQFKPVWLTNNKSIDFFIPDFNMAIEHQGSQHFKPVDFFGGLQKHLRCAELDEEKKSECDENGVILLYFSYEKGSVPEDCRDTVYTDENNFKNLLREIKNEKRDFN